MKEKLSFCFKNTDGSDKMILFHYSLYPTPDIDCKDDKKLNSTEIQKISLESIKIKAEIQTERDILHMKSFFLK